PVLLLRQERHPTRRHQRNDDRIDERQMIRGQDHRARRRNVLPALDPRPENHHRQPLHQDLQHRVEHAKPLSVRTRRKTDHLGHDGTEEYGLPSFEWQPGDTIRTAPDKPPAAPTMTPCTPPATAETPNPTPPPP